MYHRVATSIGQQWVHLAASWSWLFPTWGQLLASSHRSYPCSPWLLKPCYVNQIQINSYFLFACLVACKSWK